MKIPESIIRDYALEGSSAQMGVSYINNLRLFKSKRKNLTGVWFMECDAQGDENGFINLYVKQKGVIKVPPDILNDIPANQLYEYITNWKFE
jgi:hypothetical protein